LRFCFRKPEREETLAEHAGENQADSQAVCSHIEKRDRDLRNTLVYINLEQALFQNTDDEFHVKVAQNLDDACKLLEVGFEYVTDMDGAKLFRKRK
jgi:hypothetical protein